MVTRRAFVAFAALALAAGCSKSGDVDFTITKHYTNVNSAGGGAAYTYSDHVDLASEAGEAWGHRDKIKSVDVVGLDATMTAVHSGGPTTGSGKITLSRGTSKAVVGTWTAEPLPTTAPHSISVALNHDAMSIVDAALRDDGKFDVEVAGSTAGPINFDADVSMHLKMSYTIKVP